jgi:hypothetical protein
MNMNVYNSNHSGNNYFVDTLYFCPDFNRVKLPPSSFLTDVKTSQVIHETCFCAKSPCTFPPQNVPATAQQMRPPLLPLFNPSLELSSAAGHLTFFAILSPFLIASLIFLLAMYLMCKYGSYKDKL